MRGNVIDYEGGRWLVVHETPGLTVTTPRGRRVTTGHVGIRRLTPVAEPVRQVVMTNALWRQYKQFSGCLIRGTSPIVPQDPTMHLSCAAWLTAEAEAPSYGFVQSYDGAGISAGLLHNILVAPRDLTQGDLGQLVRRLFDAGRSTEFPGSWRAYGADGIQAELDAKGWVLAPDGKFRTKDGKLVSGAALRDWVAPPDGKVPQAGRDWERAALMASHFNKLFSWGGGYKIQEDFAIEWLARGNSGDELTVYRNFHPDLDSFVALPVAAIPPEVHVAMCVYHSFSVNSPAVAAKCLTTAINTQIRSPAEFAKALIRELGTHGRDVWHDQPGDGNDRYDRTRVALWSRVDLFPGADVRDLMPRDLVA